jgi:hypothetical protein
MESVWIVKVEWLIECFIQWKRVKEEPFLLDPSMKPQQPEILDESAWKNMDDEVNEALNGSSDEEDSEEKESGEESEGDWLLDIEQEIENELTQITETTVLGKRKHSE